MITPHPANERIKRAYFDWCRDGEGLSPVTINHAGRAIRAYELFTGHASFKTFSVKQATAFKAHLANVPSPATGKLLSVATRHATLALVQAFFRWLSRQPGYRQSVNMADANYLSLDRGEKAIAAHRREPPLAPSCVQIAQVLHGHPVANDLDKRDRAIIAFLLLTCARVDSIASLKLKHVDLVEDVVHFDAGEVRTKQHRTFSVWFFPVDPIARTIIAEWVHYLREVLGFTDDDPLFPATAQIVGDKLQFTNNGLSRTHWTTTNSIRKIVKKRLLAAGQTYFTPHLFRKTIARLGEERCQTPEQFKAWSQNMAHKQVLTTFFSYGEVPRARQAELIRNALAPSDDANAPAYRARMLRKLADDIEGGRHA